MEYDLRHELGLSEPTLDMGLATGRRARVSALVVLGLMLNVVALCAALTGVFAPEGLVLGAVGIIVSLVGAVSAGRPGMAGRGVAAFSVLCGLAATALATLAVFGHVAWPSTRVDEASRAREWLDAHVAVLRRWRG